ncbi:hypothetical protein H9Q73_001715 [Fusarium xylarioides]|nr:hypothetical protein H9Q73_001715 [Fusarium xylarioides]
MEAAGLTMGAVALVSLFKDCVDLFSMISAARDMGRDAAILDMKLDIERLLFLQWSERIGLLKKDSVNTLSRDVDTREFILRALKTVKSLLSEGQALQRDYDLKKVDATRPGPEHASSELPAAYQSISSVRFAKFLKQFEELRIQACRPANVDWHSKFKRTTKQFRWVIVDKEKFKALIADLSDFNTSLNELVSSQKKNKTPPCENDFIHIKDLAELDLVIQATANTRPEVSKAAVAAKSAIVQSRILRSLWFRWYDDRRVNITDSHYKTLQWALNPPSDCLQWDDLSNWLQSASGLYWISGKAGSGKSTLMKYLLQHDQTHALLRTWSNSSEPIFAIFFFYALGKLEQKSQSGLLRSLLYQILQSDPSVIEAALPHTWREACYNQQSSLSIKVPSVAEMTGALKHLCSTIHASKKVFFMIDGLDEYEGKDLDVAGFISELQTFPNVKILVSSRPHPAFLTKFSQHPKLCLQDLTKHDVATYIDDIVASHPYMMTLSQLSPLEVQEITQKLLHKASGVFLWVVLACRSVVEGCDDFLTITELKERVDELPKEVEDLIERMLDRIDLRWKQEAMKFMHLVYTNERCEGVDPIPTIGMYWTYERGFGADTSLSEFAIDPLTTEEQKVRCQIMEGRIRSRCGGLLEVHYGDQSMEKCIVEFMHRTVYDLLLQPQVSQRLFGRLRHINHNSYAILSEVWCRLIRVFANSDDVYANALSPVHYGHIHGNPPGITLHLLSRLQFLFGQTTFTSDRSHQSSHYLWHDKKCRRHCDDLSVAFTLAVEMGMYDVVRFVFENKFHLPDYFFCPPHLSLLGDCRVLRGSPKGSHQLKCQDDRQILQTRYSLLYHAIMKPFLYDHFDFSYAFWDGVSLPLVKLILTLGADIDDTMQGNENEGRQSVTFLGADLSPRNLNSTNRVPLLKKLKSLASTDQGNTEGWKEVHRLSVEQLRNVFYGRQTPTQKSPGAKSSPDSSKRRAAVDSESIFAKKKTETLVWSKRKTTRL